MEAGVYGVNQKIDKPHSIQITREYHSHLRFNDYLGKPMLRTLPIALLLLCTPLASIAKPIEKESDLGAQLFFDKNLSKNRTQSCATCHDPATSFVDKRDNVIGGAASLGDDGKSFGDRNAPSAMYAKLVPRFHQNKKGEYVGGQFWDGRETDLKGQAGGPPLNPVEMGMPDKTSVVERIQENEAYVTAFKQFFGDTIFEDDEKAYAAMAKAIGEFEKIDKLFAPFNSKYDRYLKGKAELTDQESLGESLFFSQQFTNCNRCHQVKAFPGSLKETFTDSKFHNLGVPVNTKLREINGKGEDFVDHGLLDNPAVDDEAQDGKFRVPTLRNVAVTGPYMHNGVFQDLRTVVLFYDQFNNSNRTINPETKETWKKPEVDKNLALKTEEFQAPALKDHEIDALVAFMKTLTDQRYEHLIK